MPGALSAVVLQLYLQIKKALRIAFVQGALCKEIAQAHLRLGVHKDFTTQATQTPRVPAFEVSGSAPTKTLHSHRIGAGRNIGRNVKFLRGFAVLAHPYPMSIYPYKVHRLNGAEMNEDLLAIPILRYFKSSDRKSTRLNSSHVRISYAVFCLKKKKKKHKIIYTSQSNIK